MNLKIKLGIVGYNNKILVSDSGFILGKNNMVNTFELVKEVNKPKSDKAIVKPAITHKTPAHEDVKVALMLLLTAGFTMCFMLQ